MEVGRLQGGGRVVEGGREGEVMEVGRLQGGRVG